MRVDGTRTDQPPKEPPAEVLPPPAEVPPPPVEVIPPLVGFHNSVEAKLMKSIWRVIISLNDPRFTLVDIRTGYLTVRGPFHDHLYEMFDYFEEYRKQLELMRNNLIKAAREVEFGTRCIHGVMESGYHGPVPPRTMIEEINHSFDSLCINCYDSECHLECVVNKKVNDDEESLVSNPLDEDADEDESEQVKMSSK
jgi:hypothetical protein